VIDPDSDFVVEFVFPNPDHPKQPSIGTTVIFRDAVGAWWRRHLAEPIEFVHDDPENSSPTPTEREDYATNARAMGIEPSPTPVITMRVRWHQARRKSQGKSPIP